MKGSDLALIGAVLIGGYVLFKGEQSFSNWLGGQNLTPSFNVSAPVTIGGTNLPTLPDAITLPTVPHITLPFIDSNPPDTHGAIEMLTPTTPYFQDTMTAINQTSSWWTGLNSTIRTVF